MLRPDPSQRPPLVLEAGREGWLGELEGLEVGLAGAHNKLAQLDEQDRTRQFTDLGMPSFAGITGRTSSATLPLTPDTS
ncbi:hypothetical protein ABZ016_24875 [Streptomyces sp. NPDC006372]|uniref:hypothetical protein n=1 Tax=Streptomyces sp. NPDC006372 TaxID=3155599 RepID=UPI0033A82C47